MGFRIPLSNLLKLYLPMKYYQSKVCSYETQVLINNSHSFPQKKISWNNWFHIENWHFCCLFLKPKWKQKNIHKDRPIPKKKGDAWYYQAMDVYKVTTIQYDPWIFHTLILPLEVHSLLQLSSRFHNLTEFAYDLLSLSSLYIIQIILK